VQTNEYEASAMLSCYAESFFSEAAAFFFYFLPLFLISSTSSWAVLNGEKKEGRRRLFVYRISQI
jgi:hypothetical protein